MWQHNYAPVLNSPTLSSLVAAIPIFVLLIMIGVLKKPAWLSALAGLAAAILVSLFAYGMPAALTFSSIGYGVAQGLFPIGWVVFSAVFLYNIVVKTGKFEIVKESMGNLTGDRRMQALLIAFAFGAFIEGAAGFGTSVAVAAASPIPCRSPSARSGSPSSRCRESPHCPSKASRAAWAASAFRSPPSFPPT
jgi:lactate permease